MIPQRFLLAAVSPRNIISFPNNSLSRIWESRLLPLKASIIADAGANLYSLELAVNIESPPHRDFAQQLRDLGFQQPQSSYVRFLATDEAATVIPDPPPPYELILCFEKSDGAAQWDAHPLNNRVCRIAAPINSLPELVWDVMFDMSLAHEYLISKQLAYLSNSIGGISGLYGDKVSFVRSIGAPFGADQVSGNAPYISFSFVGRDKYKFGSRQHISRTLHLWDQFILHAYKKRFIHQDFYRDQMASWLHGHPKFRNRLKKSALTKMLNDMRPGVYVMIVRRRSKIRKSPAFNDAIRALMSRLHPRRRAGLSFGFLRATDYDQAAAKVVRDGGVYAVRVHLGL